MSLGLNKNHTSHLCFLFLLCPSTLVDNDISCRIFAPRSLSEIGFLTQYSKLFGALLGNLSAPLIRVLNARKSLFEIASATIASLHEHQGICWIYRSTLRALVTKCSALMTVFPRLHPLAQPLDHQRTAPMLST